jgi:hypothetical protein
MSISLVLQDYEFESQLGNRFLTHKVGTGRHTKTPFSPSLIAGPSGRSPAEIAGSNSLKEGRSYIQRCHTNFNASNCE